MKLTKEETNILKFLVQDKLKKIYNGPEGLEIICDVEILKNLLNKLQRNK